MKALLVFTYNISLESWVEGGFLHREKIFYQTFQKRNVDYSFLTYGNFKDLEFSKLLDGIQVVPISKLI